MSMLKSALVAAGLMVAALTPGFAADGGMDDGMAWVLNPSGQYATGKLTPQAMSQLMKRAKPITGMVVFMANSKLYMAPDPKGTVYQMRRDMMMSGS
ncbi:MAG TPA: hypothetical protein VGD36_03915 [Xanthobacteraceae bacterium]